MQQLYLNTIRNILEETINLENIDLDKVERALGKQRDILSKKYPRFTFAVLTLHQHNVHGRLLVQMLPDEELMEM
jgi:hypothetical protein